MLRRYRVSTEAVRAGAEGGLDVELVKAERDKVSWLGGERERRRAVAESRAILCAGLGGSSGPQEDCGEARIPHHAPY